MNEMYWITRLDGLLVAIVVVVSILLFLAVLSELFYLYDDCNTETERKACRKRAAICGSIGFILLGATIFIPTTHQALIIYGVGGTIDYVKSIDKEKQLPEKAIMALDKYLESINEEE